MSYVQSYFHIVFRTKNSVPAIVEEHEKLLYRVIYDFSVQRKCQIYRIGGMPDHIHIFLSLPSDISVAVYVHDLKIVTSKFLRDNSLTFSSFNGWADYYCALSYSASDKETVINYILNQKEHHKRMSCKEELQQLLDENGISYDPEYL